jgi:uncharacterized protein (DUF736 family)
VLCAPAKPPPRLRWYLSVTLDDPSFPATVYARLIEGEGGMHTLIWSRSKPKA